jgi:hypothetical protein
MGASRQECVRAYGYSETIHISGFSVRLAQLVSPLSSIRNHWMLVFFILQSFNPLVVTAVHGQGSSVRTARYLLGTSP